MSQNFNDSSDLNNTGEYNLPTYQNLSVGNAFQQQMPKQNYLLGQAQKGDKSKSTLIFSEQEKKCIAGGNKNPQQSFNQSERSLEQEENKGHSNRRNIWDEADSESLARNIRHSPLEFVRKNCQKRDKAAFESLTKEEQENKYLRKFETFCEFVPSFFMVQKEGDSACNFYNMIKVMDDFLPLHKDWWPKRYQVLVIMACICDSKMMGEKVDMLDEAEKDLEEVSLDEDKEAAYWKRIMYYMQADSCIKSKSKSKNLLREGRKIHPKYFENQLSNLEEFYCGIRAKIYREEKKQDKAKECSEEALALAKRLQVIFNGKDIRHRICFGWNELESELKAILK